MNIKGRVQINKLGSIIEKLQKKNISRHNPNCISLHQGLCLNAKEQEGCLRWIDGNKYLEMPKEVKIFIQLIFLTCSFLFYLLNFQKPIKCMNHKRKIWV